MEEVKIREEKPLDIPILEEIFLITRRATFKNRLNEFHIGDYMQSTADDQVFVAERNGIVSGFVSIYSQDDFIHNLFVAPQYQGCGIGSKLLIFAESQLSKPMTLKVAIDNLKVCVFYGKHSWYKVAEFDKAPEPYILYRKND